jgi:hypothetical protein
MYDTVMNNTFRPLLSWILLISSVITVLSQEPALASGDQIRASSTQTITLHLHADAAKALAAFTPDGEVRWSPGWIPTYLRSTAHHGEGSVFLTDGPFGNILWLFDRYDTSRGEIQYIEVMPGHTLSRITVRVEASTADSATAWVTYERTSLSDAGDAEVQHFEKHFAGQRDHWEAAVNAFLDGQAHG